MPPPLPAAEVLITGDRAKLPAGVAGLIDPLVPLPGDVSFFEKRFTLTGVLSTAAWSAGLAGFGVLCMAVGVVALFDHRQVTVSSSTSLWPLGFGFVCCVGAWMLADTMRVQMRLRGDQLAGRPTRVGLMLTPAALIESGETSWCVIPRSLVGDTTDGRVKYPFKGQEKTLTLPSEFVGTDTATVERAIAAWR